MTTGVRATDVRPADGRVPDGRVPDGHIADGRVSDGHIADGRVSDGHIADGRVSDSHIAAGRISDGRVSAVQTAWAELIIATLADAGVEVCVVSPGSRSTPLVAALAGEPRLVTPVVIDERAAAFCALGAARATGRPVALVCTSGTAAAHWLPAVIEASEAGVPLIAITADRPPELHGCGAAQTIDQVKLFGGFVRGYIDLGPADGAALALRAVRRRSRRR